MYCEEYRESNTPASHFCFIGKYRNTDKPCGYARNDNEGFTSCMKGFKGTEEEYWLQYYKTLDEIKSIKEEK